MKHIGQNVFELPTSFRNDIFGLCDTFRLTCDDIRFYSESLKNPLFQIRNERNDANGPRLRLTKVRTSGFQPLLSEITTDATALAGQDDDVCGTFEFMSSDSAANTQIYAQLQGTIHDATGGQESGKLALGVASHDGDIANGLVLTGGSEDREVDVTVGNGTSSVTTIAGTLTMGSTAFVNNSGVVQVATQGTIDHDSLANFVAAEHYRWDTDISSTATINAANIPTLNQDTTGSAATLTTARAINGVNFDGSAAITIPTRVHGSTIKILPTDFIPNEDGGTSKGVFLDDDGTTGLKPGIDSMELIAVVIIPENYKATHVDIFDNSHNLVVNVFEMNVNASGQTSKGSGNANTTIDITDVNATATNYLAIEVVTTATSQRVFGGTVTIAAQ